MYNNVPPQLWMLLDKQIRNHLVKVFEIPRTGITEIINQDVVRDGFSFDDLKAITLEKMTAYIGSEETFPRGWEITCSKAKGEVYPPMFIKQPEVIPMADEPRDEQVQTLSQSPVEDLDKELKAQTTTQHGSKKNK